MTRLPDTRHSLLLRLRDRTDRQAWDEFVRIYEPWILALAGRRGLQSADAQEVAQEVLLRLSRKVEAWRPGADRGSFRGWLGRVARNLAVDRLRTAGHRNRAAGGTSQVRALHQLADREGSLESQAEEEYRRRTFAWAAEVVRSRCEPQVWDAFWATSIRGEPAAQVAERLGMTVGQVYVSRSRVLARLRSAVRPWCDDAEPPQGEQTR